MLELLLFKYWKRKVPVNGEEILLPEDRKALKAALKAGLTFAIIQNNRLQEVTYELNKFSTHRFNKRSNRWIMLKVL